MHALEYCLCDIGFHYHSRKYQSLRGVNPEKARVHLKKAISDGEGIIKVGGYFSASDREVLSSLEREAARLTS